MALQHFNYFGGTRRTAELFYVGPPVVTILQLGVRQGVSSDSDEQVGSTSRITVTQTSTDKGAGEYDTVDVRKGT
jgi:hypothetical protein